MVKRKDYVEGAVRAYLNAPLPDLVNDVKVMPIEQGGYLTHLSLVELPLARDYGVPSGARYREAVVGIPAIPDDPSSPQLKHLLAKDPSGDWGWAGPCPDAGCSRVSQGKPSEDLFSINAREEQGGYGYVPMGLGVTGGASLGGRKQIGVGWAAPHPGAGGSASRKGTPPICLALHRGSGRHHGVGQVAREGSVT